VTVVAGIDVGNATTEVVIARISPRGVALVGSGRSATRRTKGSPESLRGAVALVRRLERQYDVRVSRAFVAPLRPVETAGAALPEAQPETGRLWVVTAGASTAGGAGFGVGRPVPLHLVDGARDPVVAVVPGGLGYESVAASLSSAAAAGRVAAVLMEDDEAVLVANRLPVRVPVVDDVDVDAVLAAETVAVEVTCGGQPLRALTDPLRLGTAFGLSEAEFADAAHLAPLLFDSTNAVVALGGGAPGRPAAEGWIEVRGEGRVPFLVGHDRLHQGVVGTATAYALPPENQARAVDDLWTVDSGAVADAVLARRPAVHERPVAVAAMRTSAPYVDPSAELARLLGVPVALVGSEAQAARSGALTTPGASSSAVVVDLGGGTIDAVTQTVSSVAAGAGDLLTSSVAMLTGVTPAAAEWVKRGPAHRVEAPQLMLAEDGSRSFLDRPALSELIGSLVVQGPAGLLGFSRTMAPGEWRALRVRLKVELIGGNVARALRTLEAAPSTVVVVGGLAGDDEILSAVTGALPRGTAVGRGDVGGVLGHRYSVAYGLVRLGTGTV
jgi:hypothetical protein